MCELATGLPPLALLATVPAEVSVQAPSRGSTPVSDRRAWSCCRSTGRQSRIADSRTDDADFGDKRQRRRAEGPSRVEGGSGSWFTHGDAGQHSVAMLPTSINDRV